MCKSHRFVYCKLCLRRENYTLFASVCQQSDTSTDNIRNAQRFGRRKRNMHVLLNTTKLYKKCVYNTENDIINAFSRKSLLFLLLYFCKTKTSTTKKRNLLFAVFCIGKNIFPRFVFDFLHCNLPFCTQGLAEVFFVANCLPR